MDHFTRNSNPGPLILRVQEKPDYTLVRPVSPEEQQFLLAKFRPSRPGPSGWKVCYIEAFPPDVQQLYWQCLDLLRMIGTVPPSLQHATQIHLPKPSGGWRPLSMLEESFKAVEAVVVSRLAVQRDPWHSDAPFRPIPKASPQPQKSSIWTALFVKMRSVLGVHSCACRLIMRNSSTFSSWRR